MDRSGRGCPLRQRWTFSQVFHIAARYWVGRTGQKWPQEVLIGAGRISFSGQSEASYDSKQNKKGRSHQNMRIRIEPDCGWTAFKERRRRRDGKVVDGRSRARSVDVFTPEAPKQRNATDEIHGLWHKNCYRARM
jgi:hypothetical protein